jgi:hypothetical protein
VGTSRAHRQQSVLIAHRDAVWVDQAKQKLEAVGYRVTECLEPEWAADLLTGSRPFDLACISSELDPSEQAAILKALRKVGTPPRLMLLLDALDSASISFRTSSGGGFLTHRVSDDVRDFVQAVVDQLGIPLRPRGHRSGPA